MSPLARRGCRGEVWTAVHSLQVIENERRIEMRVEQVYRQSLQMAHFVTNRSRKVRHGRLGRPAVPKDVRELIGKMSRENPLWGAPRIHGELLKLGIDIGETSVGKYMVRDRKPPSQTCRTFLKNHVKTMMS